MKLPHQDDRHRHLPSDLIPTLPRRQCPPAGLSPSLPRPLQSPPSDLVPCPLPPPAEDAPPPLDAAGKALPGVPHAPEPGKAPPHDGTQP